MSEFGVIHIEIKMEGIQVFPHEGSEDKIVGRGEQEALGWALKYHLV